MILATVASPIKLLLLYLLNLFLSQTVPENPMQALISNSDAKCFQGTNTLAQFCLFIRFEGEKRFFKIGASLRVETTTSRRPTAANRVKPFPLLFYRSCSKLMRFASSKKIKQTEQFNCEKTQLALKFSIRLYSDQN